jgi:hypothetical protein
MTATQHRKSLPFLVTLAGCVLMLAWVDPAHASEVTRQLSQKGFAISQLRKSEVAIVKNAHSDIKVFFKAFNATESGVQASTGLVCRKYSSEYHVVFPQCVKSQLKADILSWMKRE